MKTKAAMILVMFMALIGAVRCTPTSTQVVMDSAQFISSATQLAYAYSEIKQITKDKLDTISEEDRVLLVSVDNNLNSMIEIVEGWASLDMNSITISQQSLEQVYNYSRTNYLLGKEVLNRNKEKFNTIDRMQLENFDRNATFLANRFELMKQNPETVDRAALVMDALNIGITMGKILVPVIRGM